MPPEENRRTFLQNIGRIALAVPFLGALGCCSTRQHEASSSPAPDALHEGRRKGYGRLVRIQSRRVITAKKEISEEVLGLMLDHAMEKLTAVPCEKSWREMFSPDDVVAIKVNCLSGMHLSSHPELVRVIVKRLKDVPVKAENIIIYDRTERELESAGFTISPAGGPRCMGTDSPGAGYDDEPTVLGEMGSRFSRIISEHATAIINVPVLKDHDMCGITCSLKNHLGSIDNPNKCHPNAGDPSIAEVNTAPCIRDKSRLIICDALQACYDGGPAFSPRGMWDFGGLLVGTDPVALDTLAWKIIEDKRLEQGLRSLAAERREPAYISTASQYHVGCGSISESGQAKDSVQVITISASQFDQSPH